MGIIKTKTITCNSENVKINNVIQREIAKLWLILSLDGYVSNKNK